MARDQDKAAREDVGRLIAGEIKGVFYRGNQTGMIKAVRAELQRRKDEEDITDFVEYITPSGSYFNIK